MLVFNYSIPEMIKQVKKKSLLYVKYLKDEAGNSRIDELSVGDEDDEVIKGFLRDASVEFFSMMEPYTAGLSALDPPLKGYEFDVTYNAVANSVVFRMIETPTMPTTIVPLMENALEVGIESYALGYFMAHNAADGSMFVSLWEKNRDNFLGYINRRAGLKRTYKLY